MKPLFFLLMFAPFLGFSQKSVNDTIDFRNFDEELFLKAFDQAYKSLNDEIKTEFNTNCQDAAHFHAKYMLYNNTLTHNQDKEFQGKKLRTPSQRFSHFNKGNFYYTGEICAYTSYPSKIKYTYAKLAKKILRIYVQSPPHYEILIKGSDYYTGGFFFKRKDGQMYIYTCFITYSAKKNG